MAVRGFVIGIEDYSAAGLADPLDGCVADALSFRKWLIDRAGANPLDVVTLLAPAPGTVVPGAPANAILNARADTIMLAITDFLSLQREDDRLYFYYSGHGSLGEIRVGYEQQTILCQDFQRTLSIKALTTDSIQNRFLANSAQGQIFLFDCCRDKALMYGETPGEVPRGPATNDESVSQYVMLATSPGRLANMADGQSFFTKVLLDGLNGAGEAKIWGDASASYEVRWDRLLGYVKQELSLNTYCGPDGSYQIPRKTGESDGGTLVLDSYQWRQVPDVTLEISVSGVAAADVAIESDRIKVNNNLTRFEDEVRGVKHIVFTVPPLRYTIEAKSPPSGASTILEVYSPKTVPLHLTPIAPPPPSGPVAANGSITVKSNDPHAQLQILGGSGTAPLFEGEGEIKLPGLARGPYRARLLTAGGFGIEKSFFLMGDAQINIPIVDPPRRSPSFDAITQSAGLSTSADGLITPAEAIGFMGGARASTLATLAVGERIENYSGKLGDFGGAGFWEAVESPSHQRQGVHLVLIDDDISADAEPVRPMPTTVRFFPQSGKDGTVMRQAITDDKLISHLSFASAGLTPGGYWLELSSSEGMRRPLRLATVALPDRVTVVVMFRGCTEESRIYQYFAPIRDARKAFDTATTKRPNQTVFFTALERSETFQRVWAADRLDPPPESLEALAHGKWFEPVAACVASYTLLRRIARADKRSTRKNDLALLAPLTTTLADNFSALPDASILRARFLRAAGSPTGDKYAIELLRNVHKNAVSPLLSEGLRSLLVESKSFGLPDSETAWAADLWSGAVSQRLWIVV